MASSWNILPAGWRSLWLLLFVLWAALIVTLAPDWELYPQYGYGWFVMPLAGFLLWKRWQSRPDPTPAGIPRLWMLAGGVLLLTLFAGRLFNSANEDWRLAKWLAAVSVIGFTLAAIYLAGGGSWLRHFGFPVLFIFTAVPWSKPFEDQLTGQLMPLVSLIAVDFLWLMDIPALRQGNLIQLTNGMIGVDEACSGIRSLQGTIMASLFLGEYFLLSPFRRGVLFVSGIAFAFVCNVVRALLLAWLAARHGVETLDRWHDSAGLSILLVCVAGLWLLGLLLISRQNKLEARRILHLEMTTGMPFVKADKDRPSSLPAFRPPSAWVISCLVAFIALEAAREGWFRAHEVGKDYNRLWQVDWQRLPVPTENHDISPRVAEILGYDTADSKSWNGEDGLQWFGYSFRWDRGNDFIRDVQYHRPDICLPSAGRVLTKAHGIQKFQFGDVNLFYKSYVFDEGSVPTHVFQVVSEDQLGDTETSMVAEENSRRYRIRRVLEGRREYPGRQVINLYLRGVGSHNEAREAVHRLLIQVVVPVS